MLVLSDGSLTLLGRKITIGTGLVLQESADGLPQLTASVSGSGLVNGGGTGLFVPLWSDADTLTNSHIQEDAGGRVGIGGAPNASYQLTVTGAMSTTTDLNVGGNLQIGATVIVTSARALQNVTASAGILTSGTLADTRLSSNVPLKNAQNDFTVQQDLRTIRHTFRNAVTTEIATASAGNYGTYQSAAYTNGSGSSITNFFLYRAAHAVYADIGDGSGYGFYTQGVNPRPLLEVLSAGHSLTNLTGDSPLRANYLYQLVRGPAGSSLTAPLRATSSNSTWLFGITSDTFDLVLGAGLNIGGLVVVTSSRALQNVTANASILTSGALADARLSSNVPLKNAANIFTAQQTVLSLVTTIGNVRVGEDSHGSLALGDSTATAGTRLPYLDFHYAVGAVQNFNARIQNNAANTLTVSFDNGAGTLAVGGSVTGTEFTLSSDVRLKQELVRIDNALLKLTQLSGYTFTYTARPHVRKAGVLAQEVRAVLPEAVVEGSDGMLQVAYDALVPLLIEAIKELRVDVARLQLGWVR